MAQTITVTITNGTAQVTTKGFKGKACRDATKQLEAALGRTTASTPTSEYYSPITATVKQS